MVKIVAHGSPTPSPDWILFPDIGRGVGLGENGTRCPETVKASAQLASMAGAGHLAGSVILTIDRAGTVKAVVTGVLREMPLVAKGTIGLLHDVVNELLYPDD